MADAEEEEVVEDVVAMVVEDAAAMVAEEEVDTGGTMTVDTGEEGVASVVEGAEGVVVEVVWRLSGVITAGRVAISRATAQTMRMSL